MQITRNTTPFLAERFVSTDKHGQKHCVLVVKATFEVLDAGRCVPSSEQAPFVYADQHHGEAGKTSVRFESDFVPVKPRVDVLLHARAVAPDGTPVSRLHVHFAGGGLRKHAVVSGDRVWERGFTGLTPSEPLPFGALPLTWDRAFGGSDVSHADVAANGSELRNLMGTGFRLNGASEVILGTALPNVEHPDVMMTSWSDKPEPVGFGPVGRGCSPRIAWGGTYDRHWLDTRRPFLPADFDTRYFQAAPLDQQLACLDVGTRFACVNMNATGRFVAEVPVFQVPVTFQFEQRLLRATLTADTLILLPEHNRLILLGRASTPLPRKLSQLREIHVGERGVAAVRGKLHFPNLADLVNAGNAPAGGHP